MISVIAIGGEPATGKSTVMRAAMKQLNEAPTRWASPFEMLRYPQAKVIVLGNYDSEVFSGTDRLSMAVQPKAEQLFKDAASLTSYDGWCFWFEGDRLFNLKFLTFIREYLKCPHRFYLLAASEATLQARHSLRDIQKASWLTGRKTKISNIVAAIQDDLICATNERPMSIYVIAQRILDDTKAMQAQIEQVKTLGGNHVTV